MGMVSFFVAVTSHELYPVHQTNPGRVRDNQESFQKRGLGLEKRYSGVQHFFSKWPARPPTYGAESECHHGYPHSWTFMSGHPLDH